MPSSIAPPGAAWHRLTLPQLAAALAAPVLADRKLAPLSQLGAEAIVARVVGYFVISSVRISVVSGCAKLSASATH